MSNDEQSPENKLIKTSALDHKVVDEINRRLVLIEKIKSTKIRRSSDEPRKEDIEELPLPEVDSMIGFATQGDVYHNDLELLHDRIKGEANAPQFVSPRVQVEEEQEAQKMTAQRTPSPFDLDDDEEDDLEDIFAERSGVQEVGALKRVTEEIIFERDPSPEPEILGGVSLTSLDQLQRELGAQRAEEAATLEPISPQQTLPDGELIIQINVDDSEEEKWDMDDLKGLMDFKTSADGAEEALEAESTVTDGAPSEEDS